MSSKNLVFKILTLFNSFAFFIKRIWGFAHKTIFCQKVFCFLSFFNWFIRFINETFCSDKAIFLGNYKPCTHPHSPTPTNTDPYPANKKSHPPTPTLPSKKRSHHPHTPTPSKKRSHSPTPSNTQHKKHHIHPHPAKKWSHLPKSTHTKPKKVTLPHTHPQPDKKGHSQPKEGHAHSCITERKNVTCLTHT